MVGRSILNAALEAAEDSLGLQQAEWASVSASMLTRGERRLDAETFLSAGYGIRLMIEARRKGWSHLGHVAGVWQPSRLKGIQVGAGVGTPFLAATQVFDMRPIARKWLALERTQDSKGRFVQHGTILVTCSGTVGRATLAFAPHLDTLISHDLLRVESIDPAMHGWLYAYLRAPKVRAMMTGARYGHIIKHLEVSHLSVIPVIEVDKSTGSRFHEAVRGILELRDASHRATLDAEKAFEQAVAGAPIADDTAENGFATRGSAELFGGRRRFDAASHDPRVSAVYRHIERAGTAVTALTSCGYRAWLPSRFRRIPAVDGVTLVDSSSLFEINADENRKIADVDFGDPERGRVQPGWLLVARSGQVYGILGSVVIAGSSLSGKVVSDDIIRIAPDGNSDLRAGYLLTAMTHPMLGRPLVKALAYGSSIPHIDVADVLSLPVVRLRKQTESRIADLAEKAADLRDRADKLETKIAADAEVIIERFMAR
jgi:hypothetical protein